MPIPYITAKRFLPPYFLPIWGRILAGEYVNFVFNKEAVKEYNLRDQIDNPYHWAIVDFENDEQKILTIELARRYEQYVCDPYKRIELYYKKHNITVAVRLVSLKKFGIKPKWIFKGMLKIKRNFKFTIDEEGLRNQKLKFKIDLDKG